jgi:hypothetical protein
MKYLKFSPSEIQVGQSHQQGKEQQGNFGINAYFSEDSGIPPAQYPAEARD